MILTYQMTREHTDDVTLLGCYVCVLRTRIHDMQVMRYLQYDGSWGLHAYAFKTKLELEEAIKIQKSTVIENITEAELLVRDILLQQKP